MATQRRVAWPYLLYSFYCFRIGFYNEQVLFVDY